MQVWQMVRAIVRDENFEADFLYAYFQSNARSNIWCNAIFLWFYFEILYLCPGSVVPLSCIFHLHLSHSNHSHGFYFVERIVCMYTRFGFRFLSSYFAFRFGCCISNDVINTFYLMLWAFFVFVFFRLKFMVT